MQASKYVSHCDAPEQHRLLEAIDVKFLLRLLRSESGTLASLDVFEQDCVTYFVFLADPETKWAYRSVAISILSAFCADSLLVRQTNTAKFKSITAQYSCFQIERSDVLMSVKFINHILVDDEL